IRRGLAGVEWPTQPAIGHRHASLFGYACPCTSLASRSTSHWGPPELSMNRDFLPPSTSAYCDNTPCTTASEAVMSGTGEASFKSPLTHKIRQPRLPKASPHDACAMQERPG